MKVNRMILILGALFIFVIIPAWFAFNQPEERDRNRSKVQNNKEVMDKTLAHDLSLTTSLFINQLSIQLDRWAKTDVSQENIRQKFEQELQEHSHIHSLGYIKNGELSVSKGDIDKKLIDLLEKRTDEQVYYSDPYLRDKKQYMIMAKPISPKEWIVGEVDLSFVKGFVGKIASVADANGNFFISSGDKHVQWRNEQQQPPQGMTEEVPELGWKIVVQSEDEQRPNNQKHYHEGEVVVKFKPNVDVSKWLAAHHEVKLDKNGGPYYVLSHEELKSDQFIERLLKDDQVDRVEPNYIFTKQTPRTQLPESTEGLPNDEFYAPYQWNLTQIQTELGWEVTGGTEEVIIAVLDTGVDSKHLDLKDKFMQGYNAFDDTKNFQDGHGHGTHVTGIAAAITNNYRGIAGVSWYNPVMPIKVLNEDGEGSLFEIASGIHWATDHGAKVMNMSLGDAEDSPILYEAIQYAYDNDVVLIAASGNDNVSQPMYPAGYKEVLAVAAVDQNQEKALFSNYGEHIDVAAPGENIPSLYLDDQYVFMSGTSMAAPHVTGLAGLIRSIRPDLSNEEVMQVIRQTAEDLGAPGHDPYYGYGEINVTKALEYIQNNEEIALDNKEEEPIRQDEGNQDKRSQDEEVRQEEERGNWLFRWFQQLQKNLK